MQQRVNSGSREFSSEPAYRYDKKGKVVAKKASSQDEFLAIP
jgi:hypothetical protein